MVFSIAIGSCALRDKTLSYKRLIIFNETESLTSSVSGLKASPNINTCLFERFFTLSFSISTIRLGCSLLTSITASIIFGCIDISLAIDESALTSFGKQLPP